MTDAIFEINGGQEKVYSVYARLVKERILYLRGEINQEVSDTLCAQMIYLNHVDSKAPIQIFINSPGGEVTQGLAIYDIMNYVGTPIHTVGMGQCASMGAFLLSAGDKRMALPSCRIMLHKVSGGARGQIEDMRASFEEAMYLNTYLMDKLCEHTGKNEKKALSKDEMSKLIDRDKYLRPKEAQKLNIIDEVIDHI